MQLPTGEKSKWLSTDYVTSFLSATQDRGNLDSILQAGALASEKPASHRLAVWVWYDRARVHTVFPEGNDKEAPMMAGYTLGFTFSQEA